ncbi:hypothetical protein [Enterobacter mori]|nr:hypothetical protein [Enterobacter mori]HDR2710490.1 hypothetical protein [Enterobacter mori]
MKKCQRLFIDYTDLSGEYAESASILTGLNRELKTRRKEAKSDYCNRASRGEYLLLNRPVPSSDSGDFFTTAKQEENGCYTVTITPALAKYMGLAVESRLKIIYTGKRLIVKNLDAVQDDDADPSN